MALLVAIVASAALILSSPYIGQIRSSLRTAFPGRFVVIVGAAVGAALILAIAIAIARIRERKALRYSLIAAALALGAAYGAAIAGPNPEVNAVEHFHFIEYGLVTFLFYRVWRGWGDGAAVLLPVLAGILVGTVEEWFQWFIPVRVGEVRDVFLNCAAIVCGLLFAVAIDPPSRFTMTLSPRSRLRVGVAAAVVIVVFALFFQSVHLGYEIHDDDAGLFRSKYDARALAELSTDRAARWKSAPPVVLHRLSREDQYMTEGVQHVQERNKRWETGDIAAAWDENRILEKYYAPVLDTPSYVSRNGHRWPPAQRADAEQRKGNEATAYESHADLDLLHPWSKRLYWSIVVALAVAVVAAGGGRLFARKTQ